MSQRAKMAESSQTQRAKMAETTLLQKKKCEERDRLLDMERRQKQRVEEMRETQKKVCTSSHFFTHCNNCQIKSCLITFFLLFVTMFSFICQQFIC